ncbi:helix-turn-helix transcriptional regulator [Cytobacillus kochii]|uniref:Transcriptional regulator n=2 Tax=Bacillaceae TaxID=186817 RepID=A0A248TPA2_9BACI|nr:helix-turn-helix transcriptional regulator [Cytobacillus kochii]ASV69920.1 transcriptional regulator [Cytobacillus kochii]MCA1027526.1 helix-turn-helix transcriptional regulator [Cytobacillus kochii]MCM3321963.1 helix-turn-helix transcriptional regulator [Cytobacillus kochii]MCM3343205.1 helix-turn-helix transcriptional regulator [Cytobacillus kochii]MDM5207034.1 helix-turn-helix transcriptional regulator [Cytobacillus kochii]
MNKDMIKFIRKSYNMTQRDFARIVSCSFSLIALVEVGKRRVTSDLENKVKVAFDLDDQQLQSISTLITEFSKGVPPFM